ncbi:MAG: hypothetical protein JNL49_10485 [Bacteroidia bacterium]|nr:hypothetical protein [Bacteroidia bacterium]
MYKLRIAVIMEIIPVIILIFSGNLFGQINFSNWPSEYIDFPNEQVLKQNSVRRIESYSKNELDSFYLDFIWTINKEGKILSEESPLDEDSMFYKCNYEYHKNVLIKTIETNNYFHDKVDTLEIFFNYKDGELKRKDYNRGEKQRTEYFTYAGHTILELSTFKGNRYGPYTGEVVTFNETGKPLKKLYYDGRCTIWNYIDYTTTEIINSYDHDTILIYGKTILRYKNSLLISKDIYRSASGQAVEPNKLSKTQSFEYKYNDKKMLVKVLEGKKTVQYLKYISE